VSSSRTPAGKKQRAGRVTGLAWASDPAGPLGLAQPKKNIKKQKKNRKCRNKKFCMS